MGIRGKRRSQPTDDSSQPVNQSEVRRHRRLRARLRMLRRLLALVLIAGIALLLWQHWDTLAPDRLLAKLQDAMNGDEGSFPVDISGTAVRQLGRTQNYIVTLSDSYLIFYNSHGGEVSRFSCTYGAPLMHVAGQYVLLAEQQGKQVQLCTRSMVLTTLTVEREILAAAVNKQGQFALLMQGPQGYAVQVAVYDRKGNLLYTRSRNQQAMTVALSPDGNQVALLSVEAVGGILNTVVEAFPLHSADAQALLRYTASDTLLYCLEYLENGQRLAVVGEKGAVLLREKSDPVSYMPTGQQVLGYALGGDSLALVTRNYGDTGDGCVLLLDTQGQIRCTVDFTGDFRHLSSNGKSFLLLTKDQVQEITASGGGVRHPVAADGQQAVQLGDTAVVLGLSALQEYALSG